MMGVKRDLVTMGDLEQDRQGQSLAPATALCAVSSTPNETLSHLTPNTYLFYEGGKSAWSEEVKKSKAESADKS